MKSYRIAILLHENDQERMLQSSLIYSMAEYWKRDGHDVFYLYGTENFRSADLLFVHVDLSVVPDSYLEFSQQYPIAINGRVKDVRKSVVNRDILALDGNWDGPVIVKSDRNCAGIPERKRDRISGRIRKKILKWTGNLNLQWLTPSINTALDYKVFDHISEVPKAYHMNSSLVIEKFLPEREGDYYIVHTMSFLGDRTISMSLKSKNPIVKGDTADIVDYPTEPHPDIIELRKQLNFDYGKFDYVVHEDKAILLDANKTVGASPNLVASKELRESRDYRAEGLYSYFN